MDFDFRPLLAVVGLGLIGYVAWDGWRTRARNNYKFKLERNVPPDLPVRPDRDGFTQDGVGRPRVRGHRDVRPADDFSAAPTNEKRAHDKRHVDEHRAEPVEPTFGDAVSAVRSDAIERGVTPDLFGDTAAVSPPRPARTEPPARPSRKSEPDVIALMVLASEGQMFRGSDLVPCMLEHDLRFGDMDIFHRHADASGQGPVLFSVANALKPGTFEPDQMDSFLSPGISLFMQLPGPQDPRSAYNLMLSTAEQIAQAMGGEVRDASRKALSTEVRLRHQELLAEHERQLFAGV
ncbi:cell division protein ZipA [Permianibacter sp. IMCC34836]|uniref:cell division protein ZipA n=1 Tax=Permianibacter fluminis TaxID=2738515 RepID=UPI0015566124|nr:cell division protein ZipA [Permianibacter fluminis]NQD38881.1 cell division protein ZipA [Permianibacter fluminis]